MRYGPGVVRDHLSLDWALDDPAGKGVEAVRPIRDEIKARVRALIAEIDAQTGG